MVKKLALCVLASVIGVSAHASLYVQGNVGWSGYSVGENNNVLDRLDKAGNMGFRVAVGNEQTYNDFGVRYAVDYTNFGTAKGSTEVTIPAGSNTQARTDTVNAELQAQSIGVSFISEFLTGHIDNVAPYAGVRLAANSVETKLSGAVSFKDDVKSFGLGGIVGVQYKIGPQLSLDLNAEYNRLGDMKDVNVSSDGTVGTPTQSRVNQYGVNAGVRMSF